MEIENATFGTITIDGKTYEHDVVIRLSGEVVKRKKKLSKKYYGTSHMLSKDEAKFVFEKGCNQVIVGSGQSFANCVKRIAADHGVQPPPPAAVYLMELKFQSPAVPWRFGIRSMPPISRRASHQVYFQDK